MKKNRPHRIAAATTLLYALGAAAETETVLETVQVRGERDAAFVEPAKRQPRTETTVSREGVANSVRAGQASVFQALDMAPSVSLESLDAYGLARTAPGGGNMRIRGQSSISLSLSVEGIPLAPPPRFGPREAAFDAENFAAVRLMKGASPVEFGNGWGGSAGSADVVLLEPSAQRRFQVKQGIGEDSFRRTYLRVDSGAWASGTRAALSYSNAAADKWRGAGAAPGKRENVFLDLLQPLDNGGSARLFVNHNEYAGNLYRALTYAQAQDIENFRDYDFNASLTGVPATDVNYYAYNRIDERFTLVGALLSLPTGGGTLRVKPYFSEEKIHNLDAGSYNGGPGIRDWLSDKTVHGVTGEYAHKLPAGEIALGTWWESYKWPAKTGKVFRPSAGGLAYDGWETIHKYDGNFVSLAPYARFELAMERWSIAGGIKHVTWRQPATLNYFLDAGLPNVAHGAILTSGARLDDESSVGAHTDRAWLPNLGASFAYSRELSLYVNAGRSLNRNFFGGGEMARAFSSNRAAFRAAGITADDLRQSERAELADGLDIGARWQHGNLTFSPTLFYTQYRNKAVRVLDPVANTVYKQAAAKASARGLELEAGWRVSPAAQLFAALTWNSSTFDADIPLLNGARIAAAGKQFPDTPRRMAKLGASAHWGEFEFVPLLKWVDARYGDVTNTQRIPGHAVVDATLRHATKTAAFGQLEVALSVVNLFDRRYISSIAAADDGTANQASYFPGAPRTVALTVGAAF